MPTLLDAYARIATSTDAPLIIGGGKGWLYDQIFAKAEALNLGDRVRFVEVLQHKFFRFHPEGLPRGQQGKLRLRATFEAHRGRRRPRCALRSLRRCRESASRPARAAGSGASARVRGGAGSRQHEEEGEREASGSSRKS